MMVIETIKDIKWFMLMVIFCIASFGNAIYILDSNQAAMSTEDYEGLTDSKFDGGILDSVMT